MNDKKKSLTAILNGTGIVDQLRDAWNAADSAPDREPLPSGTYLCLVESGTCYAAASGSLGYRLTLRVAEGEYSGRRLRHTLWLTKSALPFSKRALLALGLDSPEKLDGPLQPGFRARCRVELLRGDSGGWYNDVVRFDVVGREQPDPFAEAAPAEPVLDPDGTSFPFGALAPEPAEQQGPKGRPPRGSSGRH